MSENVTNLISTPATAQADEDDLIVNMRNVSVAVSYTHLTLPTTPYV